MDKWAQMKSALCSKNNRLNLVEIVGYFLFWVGKKLLKLKTTQNEENQVDEMKKKISHLNTQKTQRIRCYLILKPIWKRSNVQCTWGARHEPHEQTEVKKREKNTHKQPKSNNTKSLNFKFVNKATNLNSQKIQTTRNTQWKMVWNSKHFLFDTIRDFFFRSLSLTLRVLFFIKFRKCFLFSLRLLCSLFSVESLGRVLTPLICSERANTANEWIFCTFLFLRWYNNNGNKKKEIESHSRHQIQANQWIMCMCAREESVLTC